MGERKVWAMDPETGPRLVTPREAANMGPLLACEACGYVFGPDEQERLYRMRSHPSFVLVCGRCFGDGSSQDHSKIIPR